MTDKRMTLEELPMMMFLPSELKQLVMDCFVPASFSFGGDIVTEGEETDAVYVLAEGRARMVKRGANGEEIPLNVLKPGETFGATGLLDPSVLVNGGKRQTTVRASSDVQAYKLDPSLFQACWPIIPKSETISTSNSAIANWRTSSSFTRRWPSFRRKP